MHKHRDSRMAQKEITTTIVQMFVWFTNVTVMPDGDLRVKNLIWHILLFSGIEGIFLGSNSCSYSRTPNVGIKGFSTVLMSPLVCAMTNLSSILST